MQAITYRVRGVADLGFPVELPAVAQANGTPLAEALIDRRPVCLNIREGYVETPIYDYRRLAAGHHIEGPAVLEVPTTSVVVPPDATGRVDDLGNLVIAYR